MKFLITGYFFFHHNPSIVFHCKALKSHVQGIIFQELKTEDISKKEKCFLYNPTEFTYSDDSSVHSGSPQGSGTSTPSDSPSIGTQHGLLQEYMGPSRYFVMKCHSQKNIDMSVSKGAWATSKSNERKLNKAFQVGNRFLAHLSKECSLSYCDHSPSVSVSLSV